MAGNRVADGSSDKCCVHFCGLERWLANLRSVVAAKSSIKDAAGKSSINDVAGESSVASCGWQVFGCKLWLAGLRLQVVAGRSSVAIRLTVVAGRTSVAIGSWCAYQTVQPVVR